MRDVDIATAVEDSLDSETARQITSTLNPRTPAEEVHFALDVMKSVPPAALHREMLDLLDHPEAAVRARALEALNMIAQPEDAEIARSLLDDPAPRARAGSIFSARRSLPRTCRDWRRARFRRPDLVEVALADMLRHGTRGRHARLPQARPPGPPHG